MVNRSIKTLLIELEARGVSLWVENGRLFSKAPKGAMTPDLRQQIKNNKAVLLDFLQNFESFDSDSYRAIPCISRHQPLSSSGRC